MEGLINSETDQKIRLTMYDVAMTMFYGHEPVIDKQEFLIVDLIVVVVISRNNNLRLLVFRILYSFSHGAV